MTTRMSSATDSVPTTLILGVGPGFFAVAFTFALCVLVTVAAYAMKPSSGPLCVLMTFLLPAAVFGCILSAPKMGSTSTLSEATVIDKLFPVRIVVVLLLAIATLVYAGYVASLVLSSAPFVAPRVTCRRKQLAELHPTWMK